MVNGRWVVLFAALSAAGCLNDGDDVGTTLADLEVKARRIDTVEATAVAVDNAGGVTYLAFHGNLGDFEEPWEGEIVTTPCESPALTADVCSNPTTRPFGCS